jgi:23S rRNA (guanosine2251-2'-O)-methyltransferase
MDEFKVEGRNAVIELLKSNRTVNKLLITKGDRQGSINEIIKLAKNKNIIISEVDKNKLDSISETKHHQGVIAYVSPIEYKDIDYILEYAKSKNEDPFIIIADEIEDPHNLGALIRTAEIAGCHGLIIPKRRAVAVTEVVSRVSVGATEYLPIARVNNINETIKELKDKGMWIIGTDSNADDLYYEKDLTGPIAIIIGSEGRGMNRLTKENCDMLVKIPQMGKITSLNASVSGGIIMFEALKQRLIQMKNNV